MNLPPGNRSIGEAAARADAICLGCGGPKQAAQEDCGGCVVCWNCFKYRRDVTPFKYFDGTLEQWLATIGRAQ